jgi:FkbM family methyltransferase
MNSLRQVTYHPGVIRLARWLGMRAILRKGYYWWARPSDGILKLQIAGVPVQFAVHNPEELRVLESAGGAGGEQRVLEVLVGFLRSGDVVYDVGGNVGLFSAVLAKTIGPQGVLIAFEPQGQNFNHLQENLKLNGLTNFHCYRKALGDRSGPATLYASNVIGNSSLVQHGQPSDVGETVEVITGDEFVTKEGVPVPRVVKIDVEGFEFAVIQGMRATLAQPACELVCCEVHPSLLPQGISPQAVESLLKEVGFEQIESFPRWDGTFHLTAYKGGMPAQ